jgi:hypothetical protein
MTTAAIAVPYEMRDATEMFARLFGDLHFCENGWLA